MKRTLNPIWAALGLVAFCAGLLWLMDTGSAQIPTSASQALVTGGSCAATTTVTRNLVMDVSKQANVGVQITANCSAASNSNLVFTLTRSVDGSQFDTVGQTVTWVGNGTNTKSILTNIPSYGANYIKLTTYAWDDPATYVTNIAVSYGIKISAP
jgi:hypothetical protein